MSRALIALAATALFAVASPSAHAQSTALDRAMWDMEASSMKSRDCSAATMPRCWYVFFAINEAPQRQLWMLDLKVRNPEPKNANLIEIDAVEVRETVDPAAADREEFLVYTLHFKCKEKMFRIARGYALLDDGSIKRATEGSDWVGGMENSWFGLAGKAACEKNVQMLPNGHSMVFLGDFYRPVDAVDFMRSRLWKKA